MLRPLRRLAVLFSGGIDSEVLLHAAAVNLGPGSVIALTSDTCFLASGYRTRNPLVCRKLGVRYVPVKWDQLGSERIAANSADRCYHCKKGVYSRLSSEAYRLGFPVVADGTSLDDLDEDRPGLKAAGEENVIHPLVAAGMGKLEVRRLAVELGVEHPDRPHDSCLATRISTDIPLTGELLELVERLETPVGNRAGGRSRARITRGGVRLEYTKTDADLLRDHLEEIEKTASEAGYELTPVVLPDGTG